MQKIIDRPKAIAAKPAKTVSMERVVVTPDIARDWLDKNTRNRKVRARHVERLTRDMAAGNFIFTGDAIRFDIEGTLIDGQHRLLACIAADQPFETLVVYNLPPETQDKLDGGANRKVSDILSLEGFHHSALLAAACRLILIEWIEGSRQGRVPYTTTEVLEVLKKNPYLPASCREIKRYKFPLGIPTSHLTVIHHIGAHVLDRARLAQAFIDVLATGIPSYEGDAAHAYRESILRQANVRTTLATEIKWKMAKHAWNLFCVGQTTRVVRPSASVTIDDVTHDMVL